MYIQKCEYIMCVCVRLHSLNFQLANFPFCIVFTPVISTYQHACLVSLVSLLTSKDLHEVIDLYDAGGLLFVRLCLFDHCLELLRRDILSKLGCNLLQVFVRYVVFLLREENESFLQLLIAVTLRHLCRHNVNEVVLINGYNAFLIFVLISALSVICQFRDEPLDLLLRWFETEGAQSDSQVLQRDIVVHISVEKLESLLEVLTLLRRQLLSVLAACLLASRCGCSVDILGRQGHYLRFVILISLLCLWKVKKQISCFIRIYQQAYKR